jgi:uncharacterized protein (TIGR00730 family)
MKTICVYCSSSSRLPEVYVQAARDLAAEMTASGYDLVYGGADVGLMGLVASEVQRLGGRVLGVIPEKLKNKGLAWEGMDACVVTSDMRDRKRVMDEKSDAVITLPGGFGTLEEVLEMLTLKQLQYHNKPIVLLNIAGFFDNLLALFKRTFAENFARPEYEHLYYVAANARDAVRYIREYVPPAPIEKWGQERAL